MVRTKKWRVRDTDPSLTAALTQGAGLSPLIARLLVSRGISGPTAAERFLGAGLADLHDPFLLAGMDRAVDRLARAAQAGEEVWVYGDYDVDGVTSVTLLSLFFRSIGIRSGYHIPHRIDDGYGLSTEGVRYVAARGARVVVTVDCGISSLKEAELCRELGIDLIVTDHHTPGEERPDAVAVVNPYLAESAYPFRHLAGVGVAFNLALALRARLRADGHFNGRPEPNLREYLDLVALGTIADIVPLTDVNRIFVRHGLRELSASSRPGIVALKDVSAITGEVSCGSVGFRLAPRLNAAGRLEDAGLGVELLLSSDPKRARIMAEALDASNTERQTLEREILREALEMVQGNPDMKDRRSIVLASMDWHPGVIGIVASRMVDLFHRPTVLISLRDGNGRGSGRSIPAFHLYDALHACAGHLLQFGGHKYAAGLAISQETLAGFVDAFEDVAAGCLTGDDLQPELALDAEVSAADLSLETAGAVLALAPFGAGNPEPVFLLRNVAVLERRTIKERHLRLRFRSGERQFEAIGFNMVDQDTLRNRLDLAFSLGVNAWNGRSRLELRLKDVRPVEE